jgi:hypothetical protein
VDVAPGTAVDELGLERREEGPATALSQQFPLRLMLTETSRACSAAR